jgi:hypothetical protein
MGGFATQMRAAHFLVRDGESLDGMPLPEERFAFSPGTTIWQFIDPAGNVQDVPVTSAVCRVYRPSGDTKRRLSAIDHSEILTVKAGINELSVAMLLDTGASDNYMNAKLARALGLSVRPDHQGITVRWQTVIQWE